jgi:hypothetical protein
LRIAKKLRRLIAVWLVRDDVTIGGMANTVIHAPPDSEVFPFLARVIGKPGLAGKGIAYSVMLVLQDHTVEIMASPNMPSYITKGHLIILAQSLPDDD